VIRSAKRIKINHQTMGKKKRRAKEEDEEGKEISLLLRTVKGE
jgi:hypothetical protein